MQRGTSHKNESREKISEGLRRRHAITTAKLEATFALQKALAAPSDAVANIAANLAMERYQALEADRPLEDAVTKVVGDALRSRVNLLATSPITKASDEHEGSPHDLTERLRARAAAGPATDVEKALELEAVNGADDISNEATTRRMRARAEAERSRR